MMTSQMVKNRKKFLGNIWNESVNHNRDSLKDLQSEFHVPKREKVNITKERLKKNAKLEVTRFWLKNFISLHGRKISD